MCEISQNLKLHLRDNIEYLHNLGVAVHFIKMIPTAVTVKGKNENMDVIKTRNFWSLKSINKREKEWRRYTQYLQLASGFVSRIYKESSKSQRKEPLRPKWAKEDPVLKNCRLYSFFLPVAGFNQFVLDHWHSLVAGLGNCLIPWPLSCFTQLFILPQVPPFSWACNTYVSSSFPLAC